MGLNYRSQSNAEIPFTARVLVEFLFVDYRPRYTFVVSTYAGPTIPPSHSHTKYEPRFESGTT
jgi:hypothetical protein